MRVERFDELQRSSDPMAAPGAATRIVDFLSRSEKGTGDRGIGRPRTKAAGLHEIPEGVRVQWPAVRDVSECSSRRTRTQHAGLIVSRTSARGAACGTRVSTSRSPGSPDRDVRPPESQSARRASLSGRPSRSPSASPCSASSPRARHACTMDTFESTPRAEMPCSRKKVEQAHRARIQDRRRPGRRQTRA